VFEDSDKVVGNKAVQVANMTLMLAAFAGLNRLVKTNTRLVCQLVQRCGSVATVDQLVSVENVTRFSCGVISPRLNRRPNYKRAGIVISTPRATAYKGVSIAPAVKLCALLVKPVL